MMRMGFLMLFNFVFCLNAHAQSIALENLDENDMRNLVRELSANFNHTSVSGASSLGTIFGFEVGLVGGMTKTPKIESLAHEADPGADAKQIPHGELIGMVTVPAGFTVEVGYIPKVGKDDFKFSSYSLGLKWTPTDILLDWPVSVAGKFHLTKSSLEFANTIGGIPTNFDYENTITAFTLLVSKNFVLVEPYFGLSFLNTKGELDVTGSTNVFASGGMSASASRSSTGWMLGAELKLLVFKMGLEYANLFDTSRYTAKLAFYF